MPHLWVDKVDFFWKSLYRAVQYPKTTERILSSLTTACSCANFPPLPPAPAATTAPHKLDTDTLLFLSIVTAKTSWNTRRAVSNAL
jgi:hypothetical protein